MRCRGSNPRIVVVVVVTVARRVTVVIVGCSCSLVAMVIICRPRNLVAMVIVSGRWSSNFCTSCLMDFIEPLQEKYKRYNHYCLTKQFSKLKLKIF